MRKIFKHSVNGTRIKAEREGAFSYARGGRAPPAMEILSADDSAQSKMLKYFKANLLPSTGTNPQNAQAQPVWNAP
jgi:hypothetical protein